MELIRIILMGIKPDLRKSMSHYEKERSNLAEWRKRLVEMDLAEFEGQKRDNNNRWGNQRENQRENQGSNPRKRTFDNTNKYTNNGKNENPAKNTKPAILDRPWIPDETIEKRKKEGRCRKCGRKGHMINVTVRSPDL